MDLAQEIYIIVIASVFLLLVAVGIVSLLLVYQKRQLRYQFEKQQLQNQYSEELLKTRIETQEHTLNTVSREIHDNIGQLLNSSKLLIGVAQRAPQPDTLQTAADTLALAIQELRSLSKSLNNEWLEQFSFTENLEAEVKRINASNKIRMTVEQVPLTMPKDRQLVLYRIVQEAFQNALKHGEPSHIHITLRNLNGHLHIEITDDGKGFDLQDPSRQGFGITNIKLRTALLGGTVQWKAGHPGTVVLIQIPITG